ncbi:MULTISPECIES: hypothetical protein [unclassified Janthinobacterium]|uniref:hypothetical protein n=1 Tax=unclassified Janthinobacterium TaxID=2610881 RepID=UPI0012F9FFC5|nr:MULTISPECIES: hypothetical protein [unclassified Janthinobacterium]MEC5163994.1 hypothetical protein [Janthinobacterium sp. CG_S6]
MDADLGGLKHSNVAKLALCDDWKHVHWITAFDEQRTLLRMADTRILPVLPRVLSAEQWIAFGSSIEYWSYINREGGMEICPLSSGDFIADTKIHLSQRKLDEMLLAAEADAIIGLLAEAMSDIVPAGLKKSEFYKIMNDSCNLARTYNVKEYSDSVSLAVAACLTVGG